MREKKEMRMRGMPRVKRWTREMLLRGLAREFESTAQPSGLWVPNFLQRTPRSAEDKASRAHNKNESDVDQKDDDGAPMVDNLVHA